MNCCTFGVCRNTDDSHRIDCAIRQLLFRSAKKRGAFGQPLAHQRHMHLQKHSSVNELKPSFFCRKQLCRDGIGCLLKRNTGRVLRRNDAHRRSVICKQIGKQRSSEAVTTHRSPAAHPRSEGFQRATVHSVLALRREHHGDQICAIGDRKTDTESNSCSLRYRTRALSPEQTL